jgi:predicted transcriptional regulator
MNDFSNKFKSGCYGGNPGERLKRKMASRARQHLAAKYWRDGLPRKDIAEKMGLSVAWLDAELRALKSLGLIEARQAPHGQGRRFQPPVCRSSRADDEKLLDMLAMRDAGAVFATIAAKHGMSEDYARACIGRVRREYQVSEASA